MKIEKLSHNNSIKLLETKGNLKIEGKELKGKELKNKLCSLFLSEYKETLTKDDVNQLSVHYAEMLEVIRTLMIASKTDIKEGNLQQNQPINWYKSNTLSKNRLKMARVDLLQKFYEFLSLKTEAVKDQLKDMLNSFKQLVDAHKISFAKVEQVRRQISKKLGGFSKGVYIESVLKVRKKTQEYSV